MKVLDIPKSGKCGVVVAYQSPFGNCQRQLIVPANPSTPARERMRGAFGRWARAWSRLLTQQQREAWNVAGPKVRSAKRLLQSGPLTGQQHFQGLNSARSCIGREVLLAPPAPVVFDANPVGPLTISNGEGGVRLLLRVAGPVAEDIMVFGQAPCSAGRMKRRNVAYLGLLPAPQGGISDITELYTARYGQPRAGDKVFIVTRQQKDGWEGYDQETNEIVPEKRAGQQAVATGALTLQVYMHKGCTRDAQGIDTQAAPDQQKSSKPGTPSGEAEVAGLNRLKGLKKPDGPEQIANSQGHSAVIMQLEMSSALTPALSPREREELSPAFQQPLNRESFQRGQMVHPLPGGEGRGEGEPLLSLHRYGSAGLWHAGAVASPAGLQPANCGKVALQESVRTRGTAGNIDIHGDAAILSPIT